MCCTLRRAFSLLELLVTVALIAVLIGFLLPIFSSAAVNRRSIACQYNLKSLQAAISARAADHGGFGPLGGHIVLPDVQTDLPRALDDGARARYDYVKNLSSAFPWALTLAPTQLSLAPYVGLRDASEVWGTRGTAPASAIEGWKAFRCAAVEDTQVRPTATHAFVIGNSALQFLNAPPLDYAVNEDVYGFGPYESAPNVLRAAARMSRIRYSSQTLSLVDAGVGQSTRMLFVEPSSASERVTLQDMIKQSGAFPLDFRRHRGSVNVSFVDGHVERVRADAAKSVILFAR